MYEGTREINHILTTRILFMKKKKGKRRKRRWEKRGKAEK
jgi:hypothetical protein